VSAELSREPTCSFSVTLAVQVEYSLDQRGNRQPAPPPAAQGALFVGGSL